MKTLLRSLILTVGLTSASTFYAANPYGFGCAEVIAALQQDWNTIALSTDSNLLAFFKYEVAKMKHFPISSVLGGFAFGKITYDTLTQIEDVLARFKPETLAKYTPAQRKAFKATMVTLFALLGAELGAFTMHREYKIQSTHSL